MPVPPHLPSWRTLLLGWVGLVVLSLLAFGPSLAGARLWDDPAHLTRAALADWSGLKRIWFELGATQQYYPVLHSAFWLEHQLWGDTLWAYHLVNVLQHATAGWWLARILQQVAGWRGASWAAAVIFVIHPMAVESVAWITEQKNTLSLLFGLAAAHGYLRFVSERRIRDYIVASLCFVLALGSKSVMATLPPALAVVLWWREGRISVRSAVLPLLPWWVVGAGAGLFTAWVERTYIGAAGEAFALSLGERLLLAPRVLVFYLTQWAWPEGLAFFYRLWDVRVEAPGWWPYGVGVLVAWAGLAVWARHQRGPLAVALLHAGLLFPALGFFNVFPFQFSYVADHFHYHAAVALAAGLAGAGAWVWRTWRAREFRVGLALGGAVVGGAWLYLANGYSAKFVSNEVLFRANVEVVPDNWMAHNVLAVAISREPGRIAEAIPHFRRALALRPDSPEVRMGLAEALARAPEGRPEAVTHYRRAVELRPHFIEARYNLALLLAEKPETAVEARAHFEDLLGRVPDSVPVRANMAFLLARSPVWRAEAEPVLREVLRRSPRHSEALHVLANLCMGDPRRHAEALELYRAAVEAGSERADLYFDYGQALAAQPGRWREAVTALQQGLRFQPESGDAHNAIGILFAQQGDFATARSWWEAAQRVQPGHRDSAANLRRLGP